MTISILIPAYNAAPYIRQALESVSAQTVWPDEIIIVDDGSTDDTVAEAREWAVAHPELMLKILQQPNLGASAARNAAIATSTSELICFLDADDLLEPQHHALLSKALAENPTVVAAFGDQSVFSEKGELCESFLAGKLTVDSSRVGADHTFNVIEDGLWENLIRGNFIPTSASMIHRKIAIEIGLFDTTLVTSEDRDFWLRASRHGAFCFSTLRLAQKREHLDNLSGDKNSLTVAKSAFDVVLKQLESERSLKLKKEEVAVTKAALQKAVEGLLYRASRDGIGTYRQTWDYVKKRSPGPLRSNIQGYLRAIFRSILASCAWAIK